MLAEEKKNIVVDSSRLKMKKYFLVIEAKKKKNIGLHQFPVIPQHVVSFL